MADAGCHGRRRGRHALTPGSHEEVLANFDGTLLDNTIDYASFVFVLALLMHRAELLSKQLSFPAAAICMDSAFQFCQADAKTPDHFFKGSPSYWNIALDR